MVNMLAMFGLALFILYSYSVPSTKGDHYEALEDQRALEKLEKKKSAKKAPKCTCGYKVTR